MATTPRNMTEDATPTLRGRFSTAEITRRVDLTDDLFKIWLRSADTFPFKPGQYCTIGVNGIERPYSIASSPSEPEIELFIEFIPYPDGELTPLLHKLAVGDQVTIRPRAKGLFFFDPEYQNHVMVSTVTGVTPYISMLRAYLEEPRGGDQFHLLEGASYLDEFGYDDELIALDSAHPEITFYPSVSRPDDPRNQSWNDATGRINTLVVDYLKEAGLRTDNTLVYACGHPGMIEDVRERLAGTGYAFTEERFWKDDE
jgi:ferredoxin/flavodoxin---NADP+ reductase